MTSDHHGHYPTPHRHHPTSTGPVGHGTSSLLRSSSGTLLSPQSRQYYTGRPLPGRGQLSAELEVIPNYRRTMNVPTVRCGTPRAGTGMRKGQAVVSAVSHRARLLR